MKVALIGTGDIAEKHLEVLQAFEDVHVAALSSRGHPRINLLAEKFGIEQKFNDYRSMLDVVQPDAVLILVSVSQVAPVASECLGRGIPTLLEKPPGLSAAETEGLATVARNANCINMVALNRRFYSVMQRAREAIVEKGPLVSMVVEAPESIGKYRTLGHPEEVVNNILFANGIHCIDLLRYFGGEVAEVTSAATRWFDNQHDSFNALLRFENGGTGHYISNWTSPGRWSVNLYGKDCKVTLCPTERGSVLTIDGQECELPVDPVDQVYKPGFYAQARYFIDCVKERRKPAYPAADLDDAVKTMKLIESIRGKELKN